MKASAAELIPLDAATRDWDGSVALLNQALFPVTPPVAWDANPSGHALWAFELHQFEWAWPLVARAASGDGSAVPALGQLVSDHIERVPFGRGPAWEPYPLSRRLVVWSVALRALESAGYERAAGARLASEIDRGARLLARNIERDLDNNHVIANARALATVGMLLHPPAHLPSYGRSGLALLWKQLRAQVQRDGGHIEQSPHYHYLVWRDALETARLAGLAGIPVPRDIPVRLGRMETWLATLRRPDGTFPLLGDSVAETFEGFGKYTGYAHSAEGARQGGPRETARDPTAILHDSGYAVMRAGDTWVLFDAGPFGARYCPGHGHADALAFELWSAGQLILADSGVYQYEAGPRRDYFRGTAAHNTLMVDGENQSEISGSFRVGRMAQAELEAEGRGQLSFVVRGVQDGYTRLARPVVHVRTLELVNAGKLVVRDQVQGSGEHGYDLAFHFAPGAEIEIERETVNVRWPTGLTTRVQFEAPMGAERLAGQGWYSPTWYTQHAAPVLHLRWRGPAPCMATTTITILPEV